MIYPISDRPSLTSTCCRKRSKVFQAPNEKRLLYFPKAVYVSVEGLESDVVSMSSVII